MAGKKCLIKKVWALTETAKAILDNVTATICLKCDTEEDRSLLLEALQNSTDFKWQSGADLLTFIPGHNSIILYMEKKIVTHGDYKIMTRGPRDFVFIDFSASKSVLVDTIKIEEVIE